MSSTVTSVDVLLLNERAFDGWLMLIKSCFNGQWGTPTVHTLTHVIIGDYSQVSFCHS